MAAVFSGISIRYWVY